MREPAPFIVNIQELRKSPLYSEELGIDLTAGDDGEYCKWFLASILFGARISATIAKNTYQALVRYKLLSPQAILNTGLDFLINPVMREGGYVRYDGRKSTQLLRDSEQLLRNYNGSLARLHEEAADSRDLERRLTAFFGVGPVTANIFLRELRPFWAKADPPPLPAVMTTAERYGIDLSRMQRKSLAFARIEAGLLRLRHAQQHRVGGGKG